MRRIISGTLLALTVLYSPQSASAATFTVTNNSDSGAGSLRQAILNANSNPGTDIITVSATGTVTLASNLPLITESVSINGSGSSSFIVSGNDQYRAFFIDVGTVSISDLTIAHSIARGGNGGLGSGGGGGALGSGGALFVNSATVTLTNVLFDSNQAAGGNGGTGIQTGVRGGGGGGGRDSNGGNTAVVAYDADGGNGGGPNGGAGGQGSVSDAVSGGDGANASGDFGGGGGAGGISSGFSSQGSGQPGSGGFGGGGGAVGAGFLPVSGANGGFGGGGGGGNDGGGGQGGLGGGAGGYSTLSTVFGSSGGGGAALGGAIFVRSTGTLNLLYSSGTASTTVATNNSTAAGSGGPGGPFNIAGENGAAAGTFIFIQGNGKTVVLDVGTGLTRTIEGTVADEKVLTGGSNTSGITKTGPGTLVLTGTYSSSGSLALNAGTLRITGTLSGPVTVASGAVLTGTGTTNVTSLSSGGTIAPGTSGPGSLSTGNLTASSGSILAFELNGATAGTGYDQISTTGTVNISGATANLSLGYVPSSGQTFTVLQNDSVDAVTGTFNGWAEGSTISASGADFRISYVGGDGNDIVITATTPEIGLSGNSNSIASGDSSPSTTDGTDFGLAIVSAGSVSKTFSIANTGVGSLVLSGTPRVTLSGTNSSDFTVSSQPPASIGASGSSTFTISGAPSTVGVRTATVTVTNNDLDEPSYTFTIQITGDIDTDGDGIPNSTDTDDDGDGISDAQEGVDGTNSLDRGSALQVLPTTLCAEWNGFFSGRMYNVVEHTNLSGTTRTITSRLYSIDGVEQSSVNFPLSPNNQFDLLVHDMTGRINNSYGRVCSTTDGIAGDLDGRMVYYLPEERASGFQFAFALPFLKGLTGSQFVPFNTYQPSLDTVDAQNLVANWIQVSNLSSSSQTGILAFYGLDGSLLGTSALTIPGNGRTDVSGHQFGPSLVGMVQWAPDDSTAQFQIRNVRYLYDNPGSHESFTTAFQLPGHYGSGERLVAPVDTRSQTSVIEISNVLPTSTTVTVHIYGEDGSAGAVDQSLVFTLGGKSSRHIIVDELLPSKLGTATIDGADSGSVIATVMQYGRTAGAGIKYMYGIDASQPIGTVLRGSYNSYLEQGCSLYIVNGTSSDTTYSLQMRDTQGNSVADFNGITVPAFGVSSPDLCILAPDNQYGTVTVQPTAANSVSVTMLRTGKDDSYRFPTPVRQ